jgi:ribokinase
MAVIVVGSMNVDTFVTVDTHPQPGETVKGGEPSMAYGGKGANQAVAAAMAGAETAIIGCVGDDDAGLEYIDRLRAFGIDVSGVRVISGTPTGRAFITVDRLGENCIVISQGANAHVSFDDLSPLRQLDSDDVVVLQLELALEVVMAACRIAADRGARVVLNLSPYALLPADVLDIADPIIVNELEAARLVEHGASPRSVLMTSGTNPSRWGSLEVPVKKAGTVIDTTGAGDSYCGSLAAALAAGVDYEEAMKSASIAAALSVVRIGAQPDPVM